MGFLTGKTAVITGGGRAVLSDGSCGSIGYGIATAYAKEGANLVLTGRNEKKLLDAKEELERLYGIKVLPIAADVSAGENNEEKVALFCHSVFARAWLSVLLHIPLHIVWASFRYTHTGVTVLEFKNNPNGITAPQCLCYSDVSHLYASGLDLLYDNSVEI